MMFSSVLFPQPDGPSRVRNSPCLISNDTLSSASTVRGAPVSPKRCVTPRTEMAGASVAAAVVGAKFKRAPRSGYSLKPAQATQPGCLESVNFHRHEAAVVEGGRCRHEIQDREVLQRLPGGLQCFWIELAVERHHAEFDVVG